MGEHIAQLTSDPARSTREQPRKQSDAILGRRLLEIVVYDKCCRIGTMVSMDDLEATEVGDWKMPDFKAACTYAASQGWFVIHDDGVTLTTAGLASA